MKSEEIYFIFMSMLGLVSLGILAYVILFLIGVVV